MTTEQRRRVVITGIGSVNPLANSWEETWPRLVRGESGIRRIAAFDPVALGTQTHIAGEVKDFDPGAYMDAKEARRMDRFCQLAVAAAVQAVKHAGLEINDANRDHIGVLFATGAGGLNTITEQEGVRLARGPKRVSPFSVPALMPNAAAGQIGLLLGLRGMGMAIGSACASSNDAIGLALAAIRLGWVDTVIAGGTESVINPLAVAGFNQAGALATKFNDDPERASRPFDRDRDGFVLSEMATALVLETEAAARARGAPLLAEVAGYGASMDAYHLVAPPPDGGGAVRAMRAAIEDAGLQPEAIDYVSAHGTSTPVNDPIETRAIKTVFGDRAYRIPVSSLKSMVGHSAGGCGAFEAAALAQTLKEGVIPPTINLEHPDPECDLDYVPNEARRHPVGAGISNNFGFGGHNSVVLLRRLEA